MQLRITPAALTVCAVTAQSVADFPQIRVGRQPQLSCIEALAAAYLPSSGQLDRMHRCIRPARDFIVNGELLWWDFNPLVIVRLVAHQITRILTSRSILTHAGNVRYISSIKKMFFN